MGSFGSRGECGGQIITRKPLAVIVHLYPDCSFRAAASNDNTVRLSVFKCICDDIRQYAHYRQRRGLHS